MEKVFPWLGLSPSLRTDSMHQAIFQNSYGLGCFPSSFSEWESLQQLTRMLHLWVVNNSLFRSQVLILRTLALKGLYFRYHNPGSLSPLHLIKMVRSWGAWVAQSVKRLTSAQVTISWSMSLSPMSGSGLMAQSLEPASDSVSPSLSLWPSPVHAVSLSVSKINKC